MSLINPIRPVDAVKPRQPEATGVLGFQSPPPITVAAVFARSFGGVSRGGSTEATGTNANSPSSSFGSSSGGGFHAVG
jgi:hypothetical protein